MNLSLFDEWATLASAGLTVFLGTNLDNLIFLAAVTGARGLGTGAARAAIAIALAVILVLAWGLAAGMAALPVEWLRWLGLVPLGFGIRSALGALGAGRGAAPPAAGGHGALAVLVLANSSDTLAVSVPLMAETAPALRPALMLGLGGGAVLLGALLQMTLSRPRLRAALERHGTWLAPLVMILAGLYILADTGTDMV